MNINLKVDNLNIIPINDNYLNDYYEEFTSEINTYQYPEEFNNITETENLFNYFYEYMRNNEMLILAIISHNNEFLGSIEVQGLKEKYPEIGIWIKKSAQGNGYAYKSLKCVIKYLNKQYDKDHYIYEVDTRNTASLSLVKKFEYVVKDIHKVITEYGKELSLQTYHINI